LEEVVALLAVVLLLLVVAQVVALKKILVLHIQVGLELLDKDTLEVITFTQALHILAVAVAELEQLVKMVNQIL
jgi:hypothetical protein